VKVAYAKDGYSFVSDDTGDIESGVLFIAKAQNSRYFDALEKKPEYIVPSDLIDFWGLEKMKVVGVTGTKGKTTVTAAIYSFLLDLDEKPAL